MSLQNAKKVVMTLLVVAIAVCVLSLITFQNDTTGMQICIAAALILFVAAIMVCGKFCRCPHCGKRLFYKLFRIHACPQCGRDFDSGKKVVKVKKK